MVENSIMYLNDLNTEIEALEFSIKELEKDIKYLNIKNSAKKKLINEVMNDYILKEDND